MSDTFAHLGVAQCAAAVRAGHVTAAALAKAALDRIDRCNPVINAATRILRERALIEAAEIDARVAAGKETGPLAGVPYGVKDLFDIASLPTTAGAGRREEAAPATADAEAVRRLKAAGAVLVATLNMDEFAYGFVTDNARWGITRNPHDPSRFVGGSSGGSAAAVAAGMVSFALGSDTNGSIRIPASLCGLYGNKPTHSSLPMEGVYPFVHTLDDIGVFARSAADLTLIDSVLRETTRGDANKITRAAMLGGWFQQNLAPEMTDALHHLRQALDDPPVICLPEVERARSAAFLITAYEGGNLHRQTLIDDPLSFDPATRDRLIAGASLSRDIYEEALAHKEVFGRVVETVFESFDVLIAPATYGPAPRIDEPFILIDGTRHPARANLGLYTQPISFLGLPVVAAPLPVSGLPMGVQLIAPKDGDEALLDYTLSLERLGLLAAPRLQRNPEGAQ